MKKRIICLIVLFSLLAGCQTVQQAKIENLLDRLVQLWHENVANHTEELDIQAQKSAQELYPLRDSVVRVVADRLRNADAGEIMAYASILLTLGCREGLLVLATLPECEQQIQLADRTIDLSQEAARLLSLLLHTEEPRVEKDPKKLREWMLQNYGFIRVKFERPGPSEIFGIPYFYIDKFARKRGLWCDELTGVFLPKWAVKEKRRLMQRYLKELRRWKEKHTGVNSSRCSVMTAGQVR